MNGNRDSFTGLSTSVASTLAYVGLWLSGIVFLFIETKDRVVRFHAMQSAITFVAIHTVMMVVASLRALFSWGAWEGTLLPFELVFTVLQALLFAFSLVLWILLMVRSYQGSMTVLPMVGELAMWSLDRIDKTVSYSSVTGIQRGAHVREGRSYHRETRRAHSRAGRIAGSVAAIMWAVFVFLVFNAYPDYIAYYQGVSFDGVDQLLRYPILTAELDRVLPILNITLGLTIVGHVIVLAFDRCLLRQLIEIVLHIFGIIVVIAFLRVFPFDFSDLPFEGIVETLPTLTVVFLVFLTVVMAVDTVVRIVRFTLHATTGD